MAETDVHISEIKSRLDKQDLILTEIRDKLIAHIAEEAMVQPSLDELVSLWKGSKIISAILATLCAAGAALWAIFVWAKEHLK